MMLPPPPRWPANDPRWKPSPSVSYGDASKGRDMTINATLFGIGFLIPDLTEVGPRSSSRR